MKGRGILKVLVALVLVVAASTMLWFSSPVKALIVDIGTLSGTTLNRVISFTIDVSVVDTEKLPIRSVDLYIYNGSDRLAATRIVTCLDLPLIDGESRSYDSAETGGGAVSIDCVNSASWGYDYGYGYLEWGGYEYWGYGYGYGPGPADITYSIIWQSPNWPAGTYTIEALVTAADGQEFSHTEEVSLRRAAAGGGGGGGGGGDTTPPTLSGIIYTGITKTTVDIYWKTQELSTSQVEYWSNGHQFSELDETLVLEHHVTLTGLIPGTTYYYKVISVDRAGNKAESEEFTFTTSGAPATFIVRSLEIEPGEIAVGERVTISVVVANTGDAVGTYTVVLKLDGEKVATKQVTVGGKAEQTVTFTITGEVAKTYSVDVAGLAGSFIVKSVGPTPTPTAIPTPAPPPVKPPVNWWLIGGIIAGLVAVAMVVWLTIVRQRAQA